MAIEFLEPRARGEWDFLRVQNSKAAISRELEKREAEEEM